MQRSGSPSRDVVVPARGTQLLDRWPEGVDTWPPGAPFGPWGHAPHAHPYGHLVYAASGTCALSTPDGQHTVDATHAVWVPAGVTHSARFDVEFCPVVLEGPPRTGTAPHDAPDDEPAARTVPVDPEQRAALLATRRDHTRTSRTLRTLLAAPGDSTTSGDPRPRAAARPGPAQDPGRLHGPLTAPIAQALAEDPASNLTLDEWAARLHVSPVSIRRAFLTETGVPFSRWRTRARLDIAVDRLRAGEPVTAVAHAVGLSHNGLLAACRRDLGLPPSALRPQPGTRTTPPA